MDAFMSRMQVHKSVNTLRPELYLWKYARLYKKHALLLLQPRPLVQH